MIGNERDMNESEQRPIKRTNYRKLIVAELENHSDQLSWLIELQKELLEKQNEMLEDPVDEPSVENNPFAALNSSLLTIQFLVLLLLLHTYGFRFTSLPSYLAYVPDLLKSLWDLMH